MWAGLDLARPRVMGILNVTPDSFSDGGRHFDHKSAIAAGLAMVADGADIVDVGGESTRPTAKPVTPDEEQARIIPVIQALAAQRALVSVDTRHAATMAAALGAGAAIVNDVSGLSFDGQAAKVVAEHGCPVILMHMRGTPDTMDGLAHYRDVVTDVKEEIMARVLAAREAGINERQIAIDPGLGFAKLGDQSALLLRGLSALISTGYPVVVGVSRKRFIGQLSAESRAGHRLGGSLAAGLFALAQGASIIRAHDVPETVQAVRVWHSLTVQSKSSISRK